jgi:serine/threonine-protein kinase
VCFTCGADLPSAARVVQGTILAERYEVRARLGKGGMGAVFRAWDRVLEEEIALKILLEPAGADTDLAKRFRSEIRLARKVVHPNVCRIYEYGEDKGLRFISMELIEGTDLKRVIGESGLPPAQAYSIALQIAEGLEAIHRLGIVHRDLKTSNVMLDATGRVRLLDFGIAKVVGADVTRGATDTGNIVGTPEYMSPEQARAEKVDTRSDLYSLGVVTYELFSGRPPFRGDTPVSVILKHLHDAPPLEGPAAARLPAAMLPVLARALSKSREARFQTASEFAAALQQAALQGSPDLRFGGAGVTLPATVGSAALETTAEQAPEIAVTPRPLPTSVVERTKEMTVAMQAEAPPAPSLPPLPSRWRVPLAIAAAAAAVGVIVIATRTPSTTHEGPGVTSPPKRETAVAPLVPVPVALNALPWARLRVMPKGTTASSAKVEECTTPCVLALAPGPYTIELENGGLTPPSHEEVTVGPGTGELVFTMPSFDPRRAARTAMGSTR